jgi:flagellar protein FliS
MEEVSMASSGHDAYVAEKILSADPVELIRMLYGAAIRSVETARRHLAAGAIPARSAAISKATGILSELALSLSPEPAPEISRRLAELYDYMQRRLLEANFEQKDSPLAEVSRLLATLAEAWQAVPHPAAKETSVRNARPALPATWNPPAPEPAPEGALHGWSF